MSVNIAEEWALLQAQSLHALRHRYAELHGDSTRSNNRTWLIKRIVWRLQALAEGDLSTRARQRAADLANDADLRRTPSPQLRTMAENYTAPASTGPARRKARLPSPGSVLTRAYKGRLLEVTVQDHGFTFDGQTYSSLSAVAKAITGSHCSGFLFFGLSAGRIQP